MIGLGFGLMSVAYAAMTWRARANELPVLWVRLLSSIHILFALFVAGYRGDLPPAGWTSTLILSAIIPSAIVVLRPKHAVDLGAPLALWSLASMGFADAPQGPGPVQWVAWSAPHILLTIGAFVVVRK